MFRLRILSFLLAATLMMIVGCTDDNIDETDVVTETVDPDISTVANALVGRAASDPGADGLELDCIDILFPFSLVDESGTIYPIASAADFDELMMDSAAIFIVDFVYPLDIRVDGETGIAASAEELGEAFAQCLPDGGWSETFFPAYEINFDNSCLALSYPVSLEKSDATIVIANNEDEFVEILVNDLVSFVFPLTLVDTEGATITVGNVDGLFEALISCNGSGVIDSTDWNTGFEYIGCYLLQFPFDVVTASGGVITVNNHQEYCDLMLTGSIVSYAYPMTLSDETGTVFTVESEEELYTKLDECYTGGGEINDPFILLMAGTQAQDSTGTVACYTIEYPISASLTSSDGVVETMTFTSDAEVFNSSFFPYAMVEYPVTVFTKWNETVVINNAQDLVALLSDCN